MPAAPGPKAFSMSDVKARMGRYASTNFFHVYILPPGGVFTHAKTYGGGSWGNYIDIACIDASLPGSTFATHEATNDHMGITERHVYRRQFDGKLDFTFAIDREYTLIKFFEAWMGYIGGEASDGYRNYEAGRGYRVPFIAEYTAPAFKLIKYEKDAIARGIKNTSPTALEYTFVNAFPISIASMPISQGPTDLLTMTVTMDYQKYYVHPVQGKGKGSAGSPGPTSEGNNSTPSLTDEVPDMGFNIELKNGIDGGLYGNNGDVPKYGDAPEGWNSEHSPLKYNATDTPQGGSKPVQPNNDQPTTSTQNNNNTPAVNSDTSFRRNLNTMTEQDKQAIRDEQNLVKQSLDMF
tara:strand:- start:9239 stop:10288 length:1050 start_codon:yes stop_codon:yes gene_type:complete